MARHEAGKRNRALITKMLRDEGKGKEVLAFPIHPDAESRKELRDFKKGDFILLTLKSWKDDGYRQFVAQTSEEPSGEQYSNKGLATVIIEPVDPLWDVYKGTTLRLFNDGEGVFAIPDGGGGMNRKNEKGSSVEKMVLVKKTVAYVVPGRDRVKEESDAQLELKGQVYGLQLQNAKLDRDRTGTPTRVSVQGKPVEHIPVDAMGRSLPLSVIQCPLQQKPRFRDRFNQILLPADALTYNPATNFETKWTLNE